jgi:hypothetical protein
MDRMTPERTEAQRVAAALIGCVLDEDQAGAEALLGNSSHQVIGQACLDLARWISYAVRDSGDIAGARAALAGQLQLITEDDWGTAR